MEVTRVTPLHADGFLTALSYSITAMKVIPWKEITSSAHVTTGNGMTRCRSAASPNSPKVKKKKKKATSIVENVYWGPLSGFLIFWSKIVLKFCCIFDVCFIFRSLISYWFLYCLSKVVLDHCCCMAHPMRQTQTGTCSRWEQCCSTAVTPVTSWRDPASSPAPQWDTGLMILLAALTLRVQIHHEVFVLYMDMIIHGRVVSNCILEILKTKRFLQPKISQNA